MQPVPRTRSARLFRVDPGSGILYSTTTLMKVRLLPERKEIEIEGRLLVADVLRRLDLLPGTVMVIRADELLTEDEVVESTDVVEIRRVISGGSDRPS